MNTANKLTMLRILMVPLFMFFLLTNQMTVAITAFIFAASTDFIDGYVARKYNQITTFGKFIDPLADKFLVLAAFLAFVEMGLLPSWAVFIIIVRELAATALRSLAAAEHKIIAASIWGKLKTVTQMAAIIVVMVSQIPQLIGYQWIFTTALYIFGLCVFLTVVSFIDYFKNCLPFMKFK